MSDLSKVETGYKSNSHHPRVQLTLVRFFLKQPSKSHDFEIDKTSNYLSKYIINQIDRRLSVPVIY